MFTLQILDRGQTFLHPIDAKVVLLGSDPEGDVVLRESGVALQHARIEPHAAGARLVAAAETRVNGKPVTGAELVLGDRIEIGRAVLVVGRAVTRAASAEDVLTETVPRARRATRRSGTRWVPFAAAAAVLGVGLWLALGSPSTQRVRDELAAIQRWRCLLYTSRCV